VGNPAVERINESTARVTFIVEIMAGFWQSTNVYTSASPLVLSTTPVEINLTTLLGIGNAPVIDGFIRINGPLSAAGEVTVQDRSNPFRSITYQANGVALGASDKVVIDIRTLQATKKTTSTWSLAGGTDVTKNVVTSGDGQFTLEPEIANFPDGPNDYRVNIVHAGATVTGATKERTNLVTNPRPASITDYNGHLGSGSGPLSLVQAPWNAAKNAVRVQGWPELVTNPGFETNTTGWSAVGTGAIARSTAQFKAGAASLIKTYAAGAAGAEGAQMTLSGLTIGQSYTISCWLYSFTASSAAAPAIGIAGIGNGNAISTQNAWGKSTYTFTATATSHTLQVTNTATATVGWQFHIDEVSAYRNSQAFIHTAKVPVGKLVAAGTVVNYRVKVACTIATQQVLIRGHQRTPEVFHSAGSAVTPGTAGTEYSGSFTPSADIPAGQMDLAIMLTGTTTLPPAESLYVGDVLLEEVTTGTYFDGTIISGGKSFSWDDTADGSSSSQYGLADVTGSLEVQMHRSYLS
jgi:hypothetical protein